MKLVIKIILFNNKSSKLLNSLLRLILLVKKIWNCKINIIILMCKISSKLKLSKN